MSKPTKLERFLDFNRDVTKTPFLTLLSNSLKSPFRPASVSSWVKDDSISFVALAIGNFTLLSLIMLLNIPVLLAFSYLTLQAGEDMINNLPPVTFIGPVFFSNYLIIGFYAFLISGVKSVIPMITRGSSGVGDSNEPPRKWMATKASILCSNSLLVSIALVELVIILFIVLAGLTGISGPLIEDLPSWFFSILKIMANAALLAPVLIHTFYYFKFTGHRSYGALLCLAILLSLFSLGYAFSELLTGPAG